jgi:hypothetical protein
MKNPVVITMLVIAVLLIGGVAAVFLVFNVFDREAAPAPAPVPAAVPAPAPAPASAPAPAPSGPSIEDKIKSLEQTIEQVRTTGQPQEVTIVLTEAEVNAQAQSLAQGLQSAEFKVLSVRIDLQPNNALSAELQAQALGFTIPIRVNMNIGVKDGKPAVSITGINFGMLPVPQTMKDQIAAAIAQSIDNLMVEMTQGGVGAGVAFEVRSITIRETDMTIVALVKPA